MRYLADPDAIKAASSNFNYGSDPDLLFFTLVFILILSLLFSPSFCVSPDVSHR